MINVLKGKLIEARKNSNQDDLSILQQILGEAATLQGRTGKEPTNEQIEKIIRGLRDKNQETLSLLIGKSHPRESSVKYELDYLNALLPQTLSESDIESHLSLLKMPLPNHVGQAMAQAMAYFKGQNLRVLGNDVKKIVCKLQQAQFAKLHSEPAQEVAHAIASGN